MVVHEILVAHFIFMHIIKNTSIHAYVYIRMKTLGFLIFWAAFKR